MKGIHQIVCIEDANLIRGNIMDIKRNTATLLG
jgi:hypothetical protein